LSDPQRTSEAKTGSSDTSPRGSIFKKKKGLKILGFSLNTDNIVKSFFGGNSYLAITALLCICLFLIRASMGFFPDYRTNIKESRQSGIEFVDIMREEVAGLTALKRNIDIAYIAEKRSLFYQEEALILLYNRFEALMDDELEDDIDEFLEIEAEAPEFETAKAALFAKIDQSCRQLSPAEIELSLSALGMKTPSEELTAKAISLAQQYALLDYETPDEIAQIQQRIETGMGDFDTARLQANQTGRDLAKIEADLTKTATDTNTLLIRLREIPKRVAAMKEGAEKLNDPVKKAQKLATAKKLSDNLDRDVNIDELSEVYYNSLPQHHQAVKELRQQLLAVEKLLPTKLQSPKGQEMIDEFRELRPAYFEILDKKKKALDSWRHDRKVTFWDSIKSFFFGSEWQTNSSWQNIYGLLPLFTGSLLISIIALTFAVPLAVGAAIYVNQFARPREAGFLKPAIEFVQAIPSVVLGLFGVLVLAGFLKDVSAHPLLSWLPGFPIQDRLNALLAGLLLAFMAAPTVFTLAEDALNNVPKAYTEASLAMGATKLQTAVRVVVPAAISGILAAILLGFGRVIGETMVVLLVAGNKAQIPQISEGLGVVTQPVHTMTSIIAQECGEVEQGSVHYMALFMVGLILFVISLLINSFCQKILNKKAV